MSSDHPRTRHHRPSRYPMDDTAAYAPSSASSSEGSDRGTQSHYSSSRRVLAHVLARKERDAKQMHQLLKLTFAKLDEESQRASDAERRAAECLVRARTAIDARAQADADAATVRTELAMYKVQLEQAQREIFRAQEMLTGLEARRHDAEEDAARARSVARKLQEERAIDAAREDGKQQGWREGLRRGMLLGRQEAEEELLRSRRREQQDLRSRSRGRRVDDPLYNRVALDVMPSEEDFSPDHVTPPSRARNGRRSPDISPPRQFRHHDSTSELAPSIRRRQQQHNDEDTQLQRSRSRPPLDTPTSPPPAAVPEPARSRPYTPHDDSTPSLIQPIPVLASAASSSRPLPIRPSPSPSPSPVRRHTPAQIPPDNWIPRAQDADGHLSIFMPPPHELVEPLHVPDGPYAVAATPEEGSPTVAVVPPQPDFAPSTPTHIYHPNPPPTDFAPSSSPQTPRRGRSRRPREPEYNYAPPPPPPDLEPNPHHPHYTREYASGAPPPPPPDLEPSSNPHHPHYTREYASGAPPPPDLEPSPNPRHPHYTREYANSGAPPPPPPNLHAPRRIAKVTSNHSRASTHLSEFDLLAPVEQPHQQQQQPEEEELEYVDAPTEPIPRQPIAPIQQNPPLQRRRATYDHRHGRPSRGPPPPRRIVLPAPLSQQAVTALPPHPQPYVYAQQQQQQQQQQVQDDGQGDTEPDEDAPLLGLPQSERNRPHRSRTQSSGVIGISVEPPSPGGSPPSSGINTALQRRPDLLSPEHAERPLPLQAMNVQIPPSYDVFRNKPHPPAPDDNHDHPLTPLLPELDLAGFVPSSPDPHRTTRAHAHRGYEAAPVTDGTKYPASPLVGQPRPGARLPPSRRGTVPPVKVKEEVQAPLSPLVVATGLSGLSGLKGRLMMPWRRK